MRRIRQWLHLLFSRWAGRLAVGLELKPAQVGVLQGSHGGPPRFEVVRLMKGREWTIYDGPLGAEAARWFMHVKSGSERGVMEFWHTQGGVRAMRDRYQGPK